MPRFTWGLLLALGACAAPGDVRPPVAAPEAFGPSGQAPVPDRWWTAFGAEELDRLVERALAGNLELRAMWDRLAQAEAATRRAAAPLLPVVGAGAAVERVVERSDDDRDAATVLSLQAFADYEVDLWGRLRAARNAADVERAATAHDVQAAAVTLSAGVAVTWVQLLEQAAQIEVLDRQIQTNQQVHEVVLGRFLAGQAAAADVLRQRQLVEARRGDRIEAEAAAALLEHRLALLLGLPPREKVVERRPALPALPPLPAAGLPSDLLRRRPDVLRAQAVAIAADYRLASALADRYPRLTLTASGTTSAEKTRDLFDNWLLGFAAGVLDPLFDAGARQAEADRARAVLSQRLNEYGQAVLTALREVEDALALEAHQARLLASLDAQLELAAGAVERVRDQYAKGGTSYLDILDALLTRQSLERAALTARRVQVEIRISLYRALAGGWPLVAPKTEVGRTEGSPPSPPEGKKGGEGPSSGGTVYAGSFVSDVNGTMLASSPPSRASSSLPPSASRAERAAPPSVALRAERAAPPCVALRAERAAPPPPRGAGGERPSAFLLPPSSPPGGEGGIVFRLPSSVFVLREGRS